MDVQYTFRGGGGVGGRGYVSPILIDTGRRRSNDHHTLVYTCIETQCPRRAGIIQVALHNLMRICKKYRGRPITYYGQCKNPASLDVCSAQKVRRSPQVRGVRLLPLSV
jgi:hypothetical protein